MIGVWLSLLLAIGYISVYAWQIIEESRQLSDALVATELVLTREHYLSQLDGLAAAAAHELGTPLSTILVVARELEREIEPGSRHVEDIRLLREQAQRCRVILGKLTELPAPGEPFERMKLSALIEEVDRAASRHGRRDRRRDPQGRSGRAGRRAQSRHALRPRQYPGKRRRFRAQSGPGRGVVGPATRSPSSSATTGRAFRRKSSTAWASPMLPASRAGGCAAARCPDSASASSSPRPCWNAPVPKYRCRTGRSRNAVRSCGSAGSGRSSSVHEDWQKHIETPSDDRTATEKVAAPPLAENR